MRTTEINIVLTRKKEAIEARSEKLDPNIKDSSQKIQLKRKDKKLVIDDGFEHCTSKETRPDFAGLNLVNQRLPCKIIF